MNTHRTETTTRKTAETDIQLTLNFDGDTIDLDLNEPFFKHMLHAMAFHGGFSLMLRAHGDVEVDPHHLIEDIGLVLGTTLRAVVEKTGPITRFGHSVIPMDDALSEVTVDVANRPFLVFNGDFPQQIIGTFDVSLVEEFLLALSNSAGVAMHALCRYGRNSHHMVESLFKALGKAIAQAYRPAGDVLSTKGML